MGFNSNPCSINTLKSYLSILMSNRLRKASSTLSETELVERRTTFFVKVYR